MRDDAPPGLDSFWEIADDEGLDQHPLERELCEQLDAVARYQEMMSDAAAAGRDELVDDLAQAHEQSVERVRSLRRALRRPR